MRGKKRYMNLDHWYYDMSETHHIRSNIFNRMNTIQNTIKEKLIETFPYYIKEQ